MKKVFGLSKKDGKKTPKDATAPSLPTTSDSSIPSKGNSPALPPKPSAVEAKSPARDTAGGSYAVILQAVGADNNNVAVPSGVKKMAPGEAEYLEGENRFNLSKFHEALDYYEKSVGLGYAPAQFRIWHIRTNTLKDINDQKSAELFNEFMKIMLSPSLNDQDPNVLFVSGYYRKEMKEPREAIKYFRAAAELGNAFAQHMMGNCCTLGEGVDANPQEAVKWYQMAAAQGIAKSEYSLGLAYKKGTGGLKPDMKKAIELYELAASKNQTEAQNALGYAYLHGEGVKVDEHKAVELFTSAANKGNTEAQCSLGFCYSKGKGVKQDKALASSWYQKAAAQGHEGAKQNLSNKGSGKKKGYHYHYNYRY